MKKEPLSIMIVKTLLAVIIFTGLGTIIIGGAYLISMPKTDLPIVKPVVETQCKIDSDCELVYIGSGRCPSPDSLIDDYECFNKDEVIRIKIKKETYLCSFFNFKLLNKYTCKCANGKCEKVKKELAEEIVITTDKTEYKIGEIVEMKIKNDLNKDLTFVLAIESFENGSWDKIVEDTRCGCGFNDCVMLELFVEANSERKHLWNQKWGLCDELLLGQKLRIEMIYGEKRKGSFKTIYSNEFTIKEKSDKEITITTDKMEYEQGETIKVAISNTNNPIYVPFSVNTKISFYQLKDNIWKILSQHCETDCIFTCENGVLKFIPCILRSRPEQDYYKYNGPWEIQWNQKERIYEDSLCGKESYRECLLKQVPDGKFKVEFCYFDKEDVDLINESGYDSPEKKKCIESEFTIKEKLTLDPRCYEKFKGLGASGGKICMAYGEGFEFDLNLEKCVKKNGSGCSFEIPFKTLEECQEVCEEAEPKDKESCEKLGGDWMAGDIEVCSLPASDSGKECTDSSQCEGYCIAELSKEEYSKVTKGTIIYTKGRCTDKTVVFGCDPHVDDGKVFGILCKD